MMRIKLIVYTFDCQEIFFSIRRQPTLSCARSTQLWTSMFDLCSCLMMPLPYVRFGPPIGLLCAHQALRSLRGRREFFILTICPAHRSSFLASKVVMFGSLRHFRSESELMRLWRCDHLETLFIERTQRLKNTCNECSSAAVSDQHSDP